MSKKANTLFERSVAEIDEAAQDPAINSETTAGERLGTLYSECLASFQSFLSRCSHGKLSSTRGLEKCFEEYSRLKVWGQQRRAALKPSVPGSLAATLQGHKELEGVLLEIYEQMIHGFRQTSLLKSMDSLVDGDNDDGGSETLSNVSDHSSIEDEPNIITGIIRCIFETIDELYRINSLICRPKPTDGYLRSTRPILDPEYQQEYEHVRQKLTLWQQQQKNEKSQDQATKTAYHLASLFEEETATPELIAKRQSAEQISSSKELILSRRLAISNLKRRKQLGYWSAIFPNQTNLYRNEITQTLYTPTLVGKHTTLRVPDLPRLDRLESSFECPYCHMKPSVEEMNVRENWKRHVFRDLQPYICTFSDCLDPERLFLTRYDWIYHEMQLHRRRWICQSCSHQCVSKMEMTEHLRVHNPSIKGRELTALLEMSERTIDEDEVDNCPFCHSLMSTKKLLDHMAGHMEELALFSLPRSHDNAGEAEDPTPHILSPQPDGLPSPKPGIFPVYGYGDNQNLGKQPQKYITVIHCCNCGHGPWNPEQTAHCQNCQHVLCGYCRSEQKRIKYDS